MTNYVERVLKRKARRVVSAEQLVALTRHGVIVLKTPVVKDGVVHYDVEYIRYSPMSYDNIVNNLVRTKYSQGSVEAILRKAIKDAYNEEFVAFNDFVEQCKATAKEFIAERQALLGK